MQLQQYRCSVSFPFSVLYSTHMQTRISFFCARITITTIITVGNHSNLIYEFNYRVTFRQFHPFQCFLHLLKDINHIFQFWYKLPKFMNMMEFHNQIILYNWKTINFDILTQSLHYLWLSKKILTILISLEWCNVQL